MTRITEANVSRVLIKLIFLFLIGCSNSDSTLKPSTFAVESKAGIHQQPIETTIVEGTVVLGTFEIAEVNFYPVEDNEVASMPAATVRTNKRGRFEVDLPSATLPDVLYVEAKSLAPKGGLAFTTALVDYRNSRRVSMNVTPLSHMAVEQAVAAGDLSRSNIRREMLLVAQAFDLPMTLSQMPITDANQDTGWGTMGGDEVDALIYRLYSEAVIHYSRRRAIPVDDILQALYAPIGAHIGEEEARIWEDLLDLLRPIDGPAGIRWHTIPLLWVVGARLDFKCVSGGLWDQCVPRYEDPRVTDTEGELGLVKEFVYDSREWLRELLNWPDGLNVVNQETDRAAQIWRFELETYASTLHQILPGIGRALSPTHEFCFYCVEDDSPFYGSDREKTMVRDGIEYRLQGNGSLDIYGYVNDIEVNLSLELPEAKQLLTEHSVIVRPGTFLSRASSQALIEDGSITLTFDENIAAEALVALRTDPTASIPRPSSLSISGGFFLERFDPFSPNAVITAPYHEITGNFEVTGYRLDAPWLFSLKKYTPGEFFAEGRFRNRFSRSPEGGQIGIRLAATFDNAADFIVPSLVEVQGSTVLGTYAVKDDIFVFDLVSGRIEISPFEGGAYLYEEFVKGFQNAALSEIRYSDHSELHRAAAELILDAGVGIRVQVPHEGLYLTSLERETAELCCARKEFSSKGGFIYGLLLEPYQPVETKDQFTIINTHFEWDTNPFVHTSATMGAKFSRKTFEDGEFEFYLRNERGRYNFSMNLTKETGLLSEWKSPFDLADTEIKITNQDGVSLYMRFEDTFSLQQLGHDTAPRTMNGKLVFNGEVYGTVRLFSGIPIIDYIDGTGEVF